MDNFTLEAHWRHLELELSGFGFHCSCFYCKLQKHLINLKNKPSGTSLKFSDIFKLSEILRMFDIFRYFPNFQKFPPCLSIIPFKACLACHKGSHWKGLKQRTLLLHQRKTKHFIANLLAQPFMVLQTFLKSMLSKAPKFIWLLMAHCQVVEMCLNFPLNKLNEREGESLALKLELKIGYLINPTQVDY